MSKWFGWGSFFLAMAAGLIMAPIALGLALTKSGDAGCETANIFVPAAYAQDSSGTARTDTKSRDEKAGQSTEKQEGAKNEGPKDQEKSPKSEASADPADCEGGGETPVSGDCKASRIAYTTPYGESQLTQVFGAPGEAGAGQKLKDVQIMAGSVQVHEKLAPCLESVEAARKSKNIDYVSSPEKGGIGGYRATDGQIGNDSYHVYGAAIDINPETNPYCNGSSVVGDPAYCDNPEIPMELVKIFRDHGFYWGGDYNSLKDYMHFEWHGEKA